MTTGTDACVLKPSLTIHSSSHNYAVEFPSGGSLANWQPEADVLLVDAYFRGQLAESLESRVIYIEATEAAKSLDKMGELLLQLKQRGINRSSTLLGLGGGVLQDITTFVASVYMRGIPWIYVPSTFLAMADSCLGGKSSINVGPAKNLVGTFHPPRSIALMAPLARSLPLVEIRGGLAEAAKICFCQGSSSFERYLDLAQPIMAGVWSDAQLIALLHHVLRVKQWFIETDEFDQAERRLLNYGHTWGHALESATAYAVPHGLAVAIGMLASHQFMEQPEASERLASHSKALLAGVLSADQLNGFDETKFLDAFRGDKKHGRHNYNLIVPSQSNGESPQGVVEISLAKTHEQERAVLAAMTSCLQELPQ
jgi:3-dehydroquinate synthase